MEVQIYGAVFMLPPFEFERKCRRSKVPNRDFCSDTKAFY